MMTNKEKDTLVSIVSETLMLSEGYIGHVYEDSLGHETIGIGFLVKSMHPNEWIILGAPIDKESGEGLCRHFNYHKFETTAKRSASLLNLKLYAVLENIIGTEPWTMGESANTLEVLMDMTYNMGIGWFSKFPKTVELLKAKDYEGASVEMLDSLWARQVKGRAIALSEKLKLSS